MKEPSGNITTDLWRIYHTLELDALIRISAALELSDEQTAKATERIEKLLRMLFPCA